jgi:hypothetical protein
MQIFQIFLCLAKTKSKDNFSKLYATVAVPKAEELIATPIAMAAKKLLNFFLNGMKQAMHNYQKNLTQVFLSQFIMHSSSQKQKMMVAHQILVGKHFLAGSS